MPGSAPIRSPWSRAPATPAVACEWTQMKRVSSSGQPNDSSASMTDSAVGPAVRWLAMAAPVRRDALHAAFSTLRSVSVMPVSFSESLMIPAGTPVSVTPTRSSLTMNAAISSTDASKTQAGMNGSR